MNSLGFEIPLVIVLILIGGAFTGAEIALISLRESQVANLAANHGKRGRRLQRLVSNPNRFLASVQIGVTVATMLSSAFGAATIADRASGMLVHGGMAPGVAQPLALVVITLILAFLSLVLGELTPKRLGLQRSESLALIASGPLSAVAVLFRPVVWLLGKCTDGAVRILGGDPHVKSEVMSEEEMQSLVTAHESLSGMERRVISDVFAAEDTLVREVMVARPDVEFLSASMTLSRAAKQVQGMPYSRFPVIGTDVDEVLGVVHITDILTSSHPMGRAATVGDLAVPVTVLPGTKNVLDAMQEMRSAGHYLAVVVDEYGGTDGIVTIEDLIEEIVGEMQSDDASDEVATPLSGGRTEVDGRLNLDDFAEQTGVELGDGPYDTAAGYVMARLGRVPVEGDRVLVRSMADAGDDDAATGSEADGVGGAEDEPGPDSKPCAREVELVVTAMEGRRVARVKVELVDQPTAMPVEGQRPSMGG